jgi:hypothetical protein
MTLKSRSKRRATKLYPRPHHLITTISNLDPDDSDDHGEVAEGYYVVHGDSVVLTDAVGIPLSGPIVHYGNPRNAGALELRKRRGERPGANSDAELRNRVMKKMVARPR